MSIHMDHFSIRIQWSVPDNLYIAEVPELPGCRTHGKTYEKALKNIREVIPIWIDATTAQDWPVPAPSVLTEDV